MKRLPPHISNQIKYNRSRLKWSQTRLASETGIDQRRISAIERKQRTAEPAEAELLGKALGFKPGCLALMSRAQPRSWHPMNSTFSPQPTRHCLVRLKAARAKYPGPTRALENIIAQRSDVEQIVDFLDDLALDSSLELLAVLRLIAKGGKVGLEAPARYGYWGQVLIEPVHQRPIVAARRSAICLPDLVLFPQVSVLAGRVIRVDFLACHLRPDGAWNWVAVELDGPGHVADHSRERLEHRVLRFSEADVTAADFVSKLYSCLKTGAVERVC